MNNCLTTLPDIYDMTCMELTKDRLQFLQHIHANIGKNPYQQQHNLCHLEKTEPLLKHTVIPEKSSPDITPFTRPSQQKRLATVSKYTLSEMVTAINELNLYLVSCEMVLDEEMQRIALSIYKKLNEKNLMRHQIKKAAGELHAKTDDLFKRLTQEDQRIVMEHSKQIFPDYAKAYCEAGGSLSNRLQMQYYKVQGEKIKLIILSTKNALDRIRVPHSDIVAEVMTLIGLSTTGINLYESVQKKIDSIHGGSLKITRQKSMHNESILKSARNLVDQFVSRNQDVPQREGQAAQTLFKQLGDYMGSEDMFRIVDNCVLGMSMEYVEFCLASLRIDMEHKCVPFSVYRSLMERMGTTGNVRQMLSQLGDVSVPEEVDAWDFAVSLPSVSSGTVLNSFRRLCIENKSITPPEEDRGKMVCRKLRQAARKCGGILPMEVIKAIYMDLKTKKKVMALFSDAGPELDKTARMVRKMKASELK